MVESSKFPSTHGRHVVQVRAPTLSDHGSWGSADSPAPPTWYLLRVAVQIMLSEQAQPAAALLAVARERRWCGQTLKHAKLAGTAHRLRGTA